MTDRAKLFTRVAISQLQNRTAGVLRGSAQGPVVCPSFLDDVGIITDAIVKAAEDYERRHNPSTPQFLTEVRKSFQDALDRAVEENTQLLTELKD